MCGLLNCPISSGDRMRLFVISSSVVSYRLVDIMLNSILPNIVRIYCP